MPSLKLEKFGGMLPAWDDRLLPDGQASTARDCYLYSGALTGWRKPKLLRSLVNGAAAYAHRIPTASQNVADANLVFPANMAEGDTVRLGDGTYKFTATVTHAYDVLIGATAAISATNIFKAFTLTGTAGTTYGNGTCLNDAISVDGSAQSTFDFGSGAIPWLHMKAPDFGTAYNTTPVNESTSGTRARWLFSPLSGAASYNQATATFQGGTNQIADLTITGASTWLEFTDPDTTVLRSPVVDDQFGRFYFGSPSQPPQYNTTARIQGGQPAWLLGVPAPGCAPGVNVTGGGNASQIGFTSTPAPSTTTPPANSVVLIPVFVNGAMVVNDLQLMPETTDPNARFAAVIYTDEAGVPFELVAQGDEVDGSVAGTAITSSFQIPPALLTNVKYWLGFMVESSITVGVAAAGNTGVIFSHTFSDGAPSFASAATAGQPDFQILADVTSQAILETRAYIYTWQSAYGEEGPPSPPTLQTAWDNSIWTLTLFTPPTDDMGVRRNLTGLNIYRSITSATGQATFFFVANVPIGTASYVDKDTDDVVALNSELISTLFSGPPTNLQGIVTLPNGAFAGWKGNEIWFTEPYRPHAWPDSYVLTTEHPIVGLGVVGQTVVACTQGIPYVAIGANPGAMSLTRVPLKEPCLSRGSIWSTPTGVLYCSLNGLISIDQFGAGNNSTEGWITRERWSAMTPHKFIRGIRLASAYFAFGTVNGNDTSVAQQGFAVELAASDAQSFSIWPQPGQHRVGFGTLSAPLAADVKNLMVDDWTGVGLMISNGGIYYYDFSDQAPAVMPYLWRSKKIQDKSKKNYAALRIWFDVPAGAPVLNPVRTTDQAMTLQSNMYGIVRVYCDGVVRVVRELRYSSELMRIAGGFKGETWQFEVEGRVRVTNLQAATTVRELAQV